MKTGGGNFGGWLSLAAVFLISVFARQTTFAAATPDITTQPVSQSLLAGTNATFSVVATGQGTLFYQWSLNETNLTDNPHLTGSTNDTLTISNLVAGDAGNYQVTVTNSHGSVTSSNVTLTVLFPASITVQPTNLAVVLNSNATFTAQVSGTQPLSCRWFFNDLPLTDDGHVSGATTTNLAIINVQTNDAGMYHLVATNDYGSATSSVVTLTVLVPANIALQPTNQSVVLSSNITFAAAANGTDPLSYQWYFQGEPLVDDGHFNNSSTANLSIVNVQTNDAGLYQLVVTNYYGSVTSSVVALTVLVPPGFAVQPTNRVTRIGQTTVFEAMGTGTAPLSYRWQKDGTNLVDDGNIIGTTTSSLIISNIQPDCTGDYRVVVTNAYGIATSTPGTLSVVPIVAWGNYTATLVPLTLTNPLSITAGDYHALAIKSDETVLGWGNNLNDIATPPIDLSNVVAVSADILDYYSLALKKDGSLVSWGKSINTNVLPGLTNIVAIAVGYYYSLALCSDGTVVGWGDNTYGKATPPAGLSNVVAIAAGVNHSAALKSDGTVVTWGNILTGPGWPPPAGLSNIVAIAAGLDFTLALRNDGQVFAWGDNNYGQINVPSGLTNIIGIAAGPVHSLVIRSDRTVISWGYNRVGEATTPPGLSNVVSIAAGMNFSLAQVDSPYAQVAPTFWWQPTNYTLPTGKTVVLNPYILGSLPMNYQWYHNEVPLAGETNKWLVLQSVQPEEAGNYQLVAGNNSGSVTSSIVEIAETPGILVQPANQSTLVGSAISFTAAVAGIEPIGVKWMHNGMLLTDGGRISGATTTNLAIINVQTNDAGTYQLVATNIYGSTTSTSAVLAVFVPVTIDTQPTNQIVASGSTASLVVTATGTPPLSYLWYSNGIPLANGGRFNGATTSVLNISNIQTNDSAQYRVVITNGYSSATSSVAMLTVFDPVAIMLQPLSQSLLIGSDATFMVTATGSGPLSYKWLFNGVPLSNDGHISGSDSPTLHLSSIQHSDTGDYVVVITNNYSSAPSITATLTPQAILSPSTRYVNINNPNPASPYLDWATAATNIQTAIDAAVDGDLVLVTNGVYLVGQRVVNGNVTNRIVLKKAVTLQSINGPQSTRIVGGNPIRDVYLGSNAIISGFSITGGLANFGGGVWSEVGGMVSNCIIWSNTATALGGGLYGGTAYNSMLATNLGGGAAFAVLYDCTLASNTASAYGSGGGAYRCILSNCTVTANYAYSSGGGVFLCTNYNCILNGNSNYYNNSGGAASSTLYNCLLTKNTGGGISCKLFNCTVVENTYIDAKGLTGSGILGQDSLAYNSIMYFNTGNNRGNNWSGGTLINCCTFPLPNGNGNFTNQPIFLDQANGDYHFQSNSPCINSGNNAYVVGTLDIDGDPRIVGGTVDMGAYEYQTPASTLSYAWAQQYGLPTDGSVDHTNLNGTGFSVYQDWIAGLNPTNPASVLAMQTPAATNNAAGITVTWQSVNTRTYYLQRSSDLTQPFSAIVSNIVGQAGITSYTDTSATNSGPYFYRVGVQ